MNLKQLGEFGLIARLASRLKSQANGRLKVGIGDDCAVYKVGPGKYQLVTTDGLIETVHFDLATTTPEQLGRKAMAVNISDIAAMGGTPTLAFITLGIPPKTPVRFLDRLYAGVGQMCQAYRIQLAGGDTVSSPRHLFISITLLGEAQRYFTRAGARPGDAIFVTGTLGDSALGLKLLQNRKWKASATARAGLVKRHLDPTPRIREAALLAKSGLAVTAMIDVSDGLAQDLRHLLETAPLGATLQERALPRSRAMKQISSLNKLNSLEISLCGGEDYELLFTSRPKDARKLIALFQRADVPVSLIGEITPDSGKMVLVRTNGQRKSLANITGYDHFRPPRV